MKKYAKSKQKKKRKESKENANFIKYNQMSLLAPFKDTLILCGNFATIDHHKAQLHCRELMYPKC